MSTLQTRFCNFITWIRPDPSERQGALDQRDEVRDRIKAKAEADGLTVRSTPGSGSFATATGLRRHMLGGAEHEGQDIDCPFVVAPEDDDGDVLDELLGRFETYAKESYPNTPRERTKSSVRLSFVASKRRFDLVPMLAVEGTDDEQVLLRAGGERRRTSVQQHVEFIKTRTRKSQEVAGPVAFNDGVRVVKWWREYQAAQSKFLKEVPTFLVNLLCAKAFDQVGIRATYPETLVGWFDKIQSYAANRSTLTFGDFAQAYPERTSGPWKVIDPVSGENNAVPPAWGGIQIDELRDWARQARDKLQQAIAYDMLGRDKDALALMGEVFGVSFENHSG
jgi:hypothetical protein